jgi:H-type lectin domain
VFCQLEFLRRNLPASIKDALPRLPRGLRELDIDRNANIRVKSTNEDFTKTCHIATWGGTTLHRAIDDVFINPPANMQYLTGEHMRNLWNNPNDPASVRVNFERPFLTPPKVVIFLNHIDLDKKRNWRLRTTATDIGVDGFTLNIETWGDTILYAAKACWIAYPEDEPHIFSMSANTMDVRPWYRPQLQQSKEITFNNVEFLKDPTVFVALNWFDIGCNANFRINAYVDRVSRTGLVWHIDSWSDTVLYSAGASIIAFTS